MSAPPDRPGAVAAGLPSAGIVLELSVVQDKNSYFLVYNISQLLRGKRKGRPFLSVVARLSATSGRVRKTLAPLLPNVVFHLRYEEDHGFCSKFYWFIT
jgi:hypothetical protein